MASSRMGTGGHPLPLCESSRYTGVWVVGLDSCSTIVVGERRSTDPFLRSSISPSSSADRQYSTELVAGGERCGLLLLCSFQSLRSYS